MPATLCGVVGPPDRNRARLGELAGSVDPACSGIGTARTRGRRRDHRDDLHGTAVFVDADQWRTARTRANAVAVGRERHPRNSQNDSISECWEPSVQSARRRTCASGSRPMTGTPMLATSSPGSRLLVGDRQDADAERFGIGERGVQPDDSDGCVPHRRVGELDHLEWDGTVRCLRGSEELRGAAPLQSHRRRLRRASEAADAAPVGEHIRRTLRDPGVDEGSDCRRTRRSTPPPPRIPRSLRRAAVHPEEERSSPRMTPWSSAAASSDRRRSRRSCRRRTRAAPIEISPACLFTPHPLGREDSPTARRRPARARAAG